jgi:hypothetical protein
MERCSGSGRGIDSAIWIAIADTLAVQSEIEMVAWCALFKYEVAVLNKTVKII